jgi:hypothetical protein
VPRLLQIPVTLQNCSEAPEMFARGNVCGNRALLALSEWR